MSSEKCLDPCYKASTVGQWGDGSGEAIRCRPLFGHCDCHGARRCSGSGYCVGSAGACVATSGSTVSNTILASSSIRDVLRRQPTTTSRNVMSSQSDITSGNFVLNRETRGDTSDTHIEQLDLRNFLASRTSTTSILNSLPASSMTLAPLAIQPADDASESLADFTVAKLLVVIALACALAGLITCAAFVCKWYCSRVDERERERNREHKKRKVAWPEKSQHTSNVAATGLPTLIRPSKQQDLKEPPSKPSPPRSDPILVLEKADSIYDERNSGSKPVLALQTPCAQVGTGLAPQHIVQHYRYPQPPALLPPALYTSRREHVEAK